MVIGLLLHLYQPPWQYASVVTNISQSCYLPLLKLFKNKKGFKVTVNTPLSLLEWFEKLRIDDSIPQLKQLIELGVVEVVGSGAYHPILTKIPAGEVERQIILNELGLGYFYGKTEGFEGEDSMLIKNLGGFFPPELAFNVQIGETLADLGYFYTVVDESSIDQRPSERLFKLRDTSLNVVVRNRDLSLCLGFKRDSDPKDFMDGLKFLEEQGEKFVCLALDGETFGHYNKEGIALLDSLIDECLSLGHKFETLTTIVKEYETDKTGEVREASWGAGDVEMAKGNLYPKWYQAKNNLHQSFVTLEELLSSYFASNTSKYSKVDGAQTLGNLPIWDFNKVSVIEGLTMEQKSFLKARVLFDKSLNSDKYWWSCADNDYDANVIKRALELFMRSSEKIADFDDSLTDKVKEIRDEILLKLKESK